MTDRNIAIGIDSSKAVSGGRVVKRQLDEIGAAATNTEKSVNRARDSLGRFVGSGNTASNSLKLIAANSNTANTSLQRLNSAMQTSRNTTMGLLAASTALRASLIALGGAAGIQTWLRLADIYTKMQSQLRLVTTSTQNLVEVNEKLYQSVQKTRSSYEASTILFAKLSRATQGLGLSQDNLIQIVENINKSFAISGSRAEEAAYSIHQLAQGLAAGTLRGDEFNSVAEQAPKLLEIVAKHLKMNVGQLREYASQGKITADVITKALLGATDDLQKEFAKMAMTVDGSMVMLQNSVLRAVGIIDQKLGISSGIAKGIAAIASGIDTLVGGFNKLAPYAAIIGTGLAIAFGPTIVASVLSLTALIGVGLVEAIAAASTAMVAFSLSNPITALLLAITAAIAAVYHFRDEIQKAIGVDVVQIIKDTVNTIIGSFIAAYEDIKWLWNTFPTFMSAVFIAVVNTINGKLNEIIISFTNTLDAVIGVWNKFLETIGSTPVKTFAEEGTFQLPHIFNDSLVELELALKEREKIIKDAMGKDYLGDLMKLFTPSVPGASTTSVPGATTPAPQPEYDKLVKTATDRIRTLQMEAEALKLTGYEASVYREQQTLINQAMAEGVKLNEEMTANLKALGEQMAMLKSQAAGMSMLQDQQSSISRLQLERQLITATTAERERSLAVYDAEQQMIQKGINLQGQQADAIRANAAAMSQLKLENERISAAYETIQQTGASAIDTLVNGAITVGNSWKDTMRSILQSFVSTFAQLSVANPLKNMLFGSNLPTIQDLFSGKSSATFTPGTTTTGSMTVTAGTVMVNGGMLPGLTSGTANTTLGQFLGIPSAANQNFVRPELTPGGIVNSPVTNSAISGLLNDPSLAARSSSIPSTNIEAYIRQAALARGIDPNVAVRVAQSEGGLNSWNLQSQYSKNGIQEPSYGPFQLLKGGQGTGYPTGLGNDFMNKTGLDPAMAANGPAGVDFALDHASRNGWGAWYGADKAGISKWEGIGPRPAIDPTTTNSIPNTEEATASLNKLASSSLKASTDVTSLSTGADTAAQALSTSSNSVTSSVSSLATTTAQIPQQTSSMFSTMTSSISGGFSSLFSGIGSIFSGLFADGAAFNNGNVIPFARGGVVSKPTMFPMARGMGVMGERGPEGILPLRRGPDGRLGVSMHGGVSTGQSQTVNNKLEMHTVIKVEGTGDKELQERITKGVDDQMRKGFKQFSLNDLPTRVKEINSDRWARG